MKLFKRSDPIPERPDLGSMMRDYHTSYQNMFGKYWTPGPYEMTVYTTGWGKVMFSAKGLTEHEVRTIHMISMYRPCVITSVEGSMAVRFGEELPKGRL